ncbi:hypothetical protein DDZ13_15015 [Coraliomargarita sinensis]|uniref:DUF4760 domain-containing protein n=1 Tax=Coraliomargarita sinensis TaxID=2174842 RepID=A0A317ZGE7_9BACT|nr:hypothetical protein [Coraliomargarita sinensis]PXA02849.1 hypothetical protein DDZ13_15015 [Coraliomargarita sinensis]
MNKLKQISAVYWIAILFTISLLIFLCVVDSADRASGLGGIYGAFIGVLLAYAFSRHSKRKDDELEKHEASIDALLLLQVQLNDLHNTKEEYVDKLRKHIEKDKGLFNPYLTEPTGSHINPKSLLWLMRTKDKQLFLDIRIAQEHYFTLYMIIENRNLELEKCSMMEQIEKTPVAGFTGRIPKSQHTIKAKELEALIVKRFDKSYSQYKEVSERLHRLIIQTFSTLPKPPKFNLPEA